MTLKALRINAGLDQRTAAEKLSITPETLSSWERAKSFPNVPQITKIEELYSVKYSDINFLPSNVGLTEEE
ncbi:MAG: helix-turn-helix transcriptional regulator [Clostridiales bacterium]|nr:helix-turn-helix transcriptional regulator [Clostridiales bacterium]